MITTLCFAWNVETFMYLLRAQSLAFFGCCFENRWVVRARWRGMAAHSPRRVLWLFGWWQAWWLILDRTKYYCCQIIGFWVFTAAMDSVDFAEQQTSSILSSNITGHAPAAALKYSILAVCVLSFLGSSLILISYVLFKTIRSRSRHILVCLSVADLGVAVSNGTGLLGSHSSSICQGQAAAATFFGASCLLWTIALAVYLYAAVVLQWQVIKNIRIMIVFYVICWGIPLAVTGTLIGMNLLGGRPSSVTGWQGWWCVLKPDISNVKSTIFIFLASELWAYLAYILVPILYFRTRFHIQKEVSLSLKIGS